jgi:hypothetical protein
MDLKNKSPKEVVQMMASTPLYRGIPIYEDVYLPYTDSETGEEVHAKLMTLPGKGTFLLCSPSFLVKMKGKFNEEE